MKRRRVFITDFQVANTCVQDRLQTCFLVVLDRPMIAYHRRSLTTTTVAAPFTRRNVFVEAMAEAIAAFVIVRA
jgi:hypothetical protein